MALQHLTIEPEGGTPIRVRFNPERYTVTKAVQIAEIAIPGLDSPVQQFVRGQTEKVQFELHFDTTEFGVVEGVKDVRELTGPIYKLLKVKKERHAPPRCKLTWGAGGKIFSYGTRVSPPWCLLESVSEEFTLFSPTGVPRRAKLNVTFREAWTIEDQLLETPRHSGNRSKARPLGPGQTLAHLAWQEYGDATAWRAIAEANDLDDPLAVSAGQMLRVPRLTGEQ